MKLKQYYENLQEFIAEHPEALELEVIAAKDDEGNGYSKVNYQPELRYAADLQSYHVDDVYTTGDYYEEYGENVTANCVVIN